jgi:hypothetical protein
VGALATMHNQQAIDSLRDAVEDAIPYIADAMNSSTSGTQAVEMFTDLCTPDGGMDEASAADYADMCYYSSTGDMEDIYTSQLAISLLHEVRKGRGVEDKEPFFRANEELRDNIGKVLRAVQSSRFIEGAVDNWNSGSNDGRGDHQRTLELMTALYDRVSSKGNVDDEVEVFRALQAHNFVDFYQYDPVEEANIAAISSYVGLGDAIMEASRKTRMDYDAVVAMMVQRDFRDGPQLTEFIDNHRGAAVLIEGSL